MADSRHNGNETYGGATGSRRRRLTRSRGSGLSMVDGGKAAGHGATQPATAGNTARPAKRDGSTVARADGNATAGNAGSRERAGVRQAGSDGGAANGSRHDSHAGMQAGGGAHGSAGGGGIPRATWSSGSTRDANHDAAAPSHAGGGAGTGDAIRGAVSRPDGVIGDGMASGRDAGDTGMRGRVSGSQTAYGSVVASGGGAPSDGSAAASGGGTQSSDGTDGDKVSGGGGFTAEERRLYEETHAPLGDRVRRALADSSVPLVCVVVIGVAIALRFLMAFSSAILTVLAIGVGIILMGSIIYITYEDQRKANALADEAEMLYAAKSRIEGKPRHKQGRTDGSDGTDAADGSGDDGGNA